MKASDDITDLFARFLSLYPKNDKKDMNTRAQECRTPLPAKSVTKNSVGKHHASNSTANHAAAHLASATANKSSLLQNM